MLFLACSMYVVLSVPAESNDLNMRYQLFVSEQRKEQIDITQNNVH
jgi:hypothetical protein